MHDMSNHYLHVGVKVTELNHFIRQLHVLWQNTPVIIDGDGWNVWGESVGSNGNDDVTLHVVMPIMNSVAHVASTIAGNIIKSIPRTETNAHGINWILTPAEDWTIVVDWSLEDPPVKTEN